MKNIKIKQIIKRNRNTYQVIMEQKTLLLFDETILHYNLLLKKSITQEELDSMIQYNNECQSYYDAVNYISKKMRSQKEVYIYLEKKGYSETNIHKTIERLIKEKVIDDQLYTYYYIKDSLKFKIDGPNKIRNKLFNLGIDKELLEEELSKIEYKEWINKINQIIEKKSFIYKKESNRFFKEKLNQYLYLNGYPKDLFAEITSEISCLNDEDNLKKELTKWQKKLALKYTGSILQSKLVQKLLTKGYEYEDIKKHLS